MKRLAVVVAVSIAGGIAVAQVRETVNVNVNTVGSEDGRIKIISLVAAYHAGD